MIKKNSFIIVLCFLITFSLTYAMDKPVDMHGHKILPFSEVCGATFLGNNQLVLQTNNRALLIDLTQNIAPLELAHYTTTQCRMHTNQEKTAVVVYDYSDHQGKATIYDTKERSCNNLQKLEDMPVFTNTPDTVAVKKNNEWFLYNYVTKIEMTNAALNTITAADNTMEQYTLQYHPTKNQCSFSPWESEVITYDLSNKNHLYTIKSQNLLLNYKYSPDGCFLACISRINHTCRYKHVNNETHLYSISESTPIPLLKNIYPKAIFFTFHPSSAFYVSYTHSDNIDSDKFIEYWNLETNKCIAKQQLIDEQKTPLYNESNNSSFSADGRLLAVSFEERCVIYTVPFEVIGKKAYPLTTKEKMIALLCLLKNFQHNNEPLLPEIARLIVKNTLTVSELTGN